MHKISLVPEMTDIYMEHETFLAFQNLSTLLTLFGVGSYRLGRSRCLFCIQKTKNQYLTPVSVLVQIENILTQRKGVTGTIFKFNDTETSKCINNVLACAVSVLMDIELFHQNSDLYDQYTIVMSSQSYFVVITARP